MQSDDSYSNTHTPTLDACFKFCTREGANHVVYGTSGPIYCNFGGCACWCFFKGCVEIYSRNSDLYVRVKGGFSLTEK